jgi:hypothetical protein
VLFEADYKRIYYIPTLESKLSYCLNHKTDWHNPNATRTASALAVLQNEIKNELKFIGEDKFAEVDKLAIGALDSAVLQRTAMFLTHLKEYYSLKAKRVSEEKEAMVAEMTDTSVKSAQFEARRNRFVNKAVTDAVENISSPERIVEYKGTLVQKIYPVYLDDHKPSNTFDFSANLYQPTKHFMGYYFDTLYFNVAVIWCMTVLLFVTLYLDGLKRLIKRLEGSRRYRAAEK